MSVPVSQEPSGLRFGSQSELDVASICGLGARQWALASHNPGKLREYQATLAPVLTPAGIELVGADSLNLQEPDEPFGTFVENALAKARYVSQQTGLPALADDSGLCVRALQGAPGVLSARYAQWMEHEGEMSFVNNQKDMSKDELNWRTLLERMKSVSDRAAHFSCWQVLVRPSGP